MGAAGAAGSAAGAAAAAAAVAQAIKASGAVVRVEPGDFAALAARCEQPLVVVARGGWFSRKYQYLMGYKGLVFHTRSADPVELPRSAEFVAARKIWIPA